MSASGAPLHIPVLRFGQEYRSLDVHAVSDFRSGEVLAEVSQANAGILRRDLRKSADAAEQLAKVPLARWFEICRDAARRFREDALPLGEGGAPQSPEQYARTLSRTSGMPVVLCQRNMEKIAHVLAEMPTILAGLTRGLEPEIIERGTGLEDGRLVCYGRRANSLGVVLPSNSPGVNSIWIPAVALRVPVILKPGREEPWTPLRIVHALYESGCPREAFGFYSTSHEGAAALLEGADRSLLFGDDKTTAPYAGRRDIERHGPGRSKILLLDDAMEDLDRHLDVLVRSMVENGGRSCVNVSAIWVTRNGAGVAERVAERVKDIVARPLDDPEAGLCAFANRKLGEWIDGTIESGLAAGGAVDVTARLRGGPRTEEVEGAMFLRPTVIHCESPEHALANTEFLFPFTSVVEMPAEEMLRRVPGSLVVSAITRDRAFQRRLLATPGVHRINLGPLPTNRVEWDQPHEGNLFEFLYERLAIQASDGWGLQP